MYKLISNQGSVKQGIFNDRLDFTYQDNNGGIFRYSDANNSLINLGKASSSSNLSLGGNYLSDLSPTTEIKTYIYKLDKSLALVRKLDSEVFGWQSDSSYSFVKIPKNIIENSIEFEDGVKGQLTAGDVESPAEKKLTEVTASKIFDLSDPDYIIFGIDKSADESGSPLDLYKYNVKNQQKVLIANSIAITASRTANNKVLFKELVNNIRYIDKNGDIKDTKLSTDIKNTDYLDDNNLITILIDKKGKNIIAKYNLVTQKTKNLFELRDDIKNPTNLYYENNKLIIANDVGIWLVELKGLAL